MLNTIGFTFDFPRLLKRTLMLCLIGTLAATIAFAQQSEDEENFIKPSRPDAADPAEFQTAGVLQIEYGFDASFRAEEFRDQLRTPFTARYAASERVLLELDADAVDSESQESFNPATNQFSRARETGVGDVRLGFQVLAAKDAARRPALAFAYLVKLPTASSEKGLGSGRTDHRVTALVSKEFEKTDIDFNLAYLNVGREDSDRRASGGQAAFSVTRELTKRWHFIGEVSGQSEEDILPRGIYPLAAVTYRINKRIEIDSGVRFGIGAQAPKAGVFGGITVGVARLFKRAN